jgi:hypothetical protein
VWPAEFDPGASHGFPGAVPVKRASCLHLTLGMGVVIDTTLPFNTVDCSPCTKAHGSA